MGLPKAVRSFRIFNGKIQHLFRSGDGGDGADQPLLLEFLHEHDKAGALKSQPVGLGNAAVGEIELGRILAVPADLFDFFAFFKTGGPGLHQKKVDGLVGFADPGVPGGQNQQVAVDSVADKGLLAVQDQFVPGFNRRGPDGRQIASRVGLGHGDGGDQVPGTAAGQVFPFHFFRAELGNVGDDHVAVQGGGQSAVVGLGQFLTDDHGVEKVRPGPAIFLRDHRTEKALVAHLLPGTSGDDPRFLPFFNIRDDLFFKKPPQGVAKDTVFFGVL